jgi:hypothetical protein
MRVGWTHSTLARLSLLTADRTLGAIDTPIAPIFLHRRAPSFSLARSVGSAGLSRKRRFWSLSWLPSSHRHPNRPAASFRDRWPRIFYRRLDAFLPTPRHIRSMIGYKVVVVGVPAFAVEITCTDGAHSLRGFRTEAAALMWIADQEFRAANAEVVATDACIRLRGSEDSALVA